MHLAPSGATPLDALRSYRGGVADWEIWLSLRHNLDSQA